MIPRSCITGRTGLYKTTNRAVSWQAVSPDLTNGGANSNVVYGTITAIAVAPSNSQFIYVGTDDGNAWRTENGGGDWVNISSGLPLRWITRVAADPYDENIVYVTLSGYRYDSYLPHVFRSIDGGANWQDITGNLPEAPANDIIVDPALESTLYLATDFGVFITHDLGQNWSMLGDNLPNVPVVDLDFHQPTRTLIAATYGRSMYTFDVDQLIGINPEWNVKDVTWSVFPNPAQDNIWICCPLSVQDYAYQIYDYQGKFITHGNISGNSSPVKIDLAELQNGVYFIKLKDHKKVLGIRKLVIIN